MNEEFKKILADFFVASTQNLYLTPSSNIDILTLVCGICYEEQRQERETKAQEREDFSSGR